MWPGLGGILVKKIALAVFLVLAAAHLSAAAENAKPVADFISRFERWWRTRHFRRRRPGPSREEQLAALPRLQAVLLGDDAALKRRAICVLCWMYPLSDGSAPALVARLSDPGADVRTAAAFALGTFLPDAERVAPALRNALADKEAAVREGAALSLGGLGPNSAAALPELEKQADADRDPLARAAAVEAILRIDAARGAKRLLADLDAPVAEVRIAAAWGVRLLRPKAVDAPKVAAALSRIVADEKADHRLRYEAFRTLSRCFPGRPEALAAARAALLCTHKGGSYARTPWRYALAFDQFLGMRSPWWTNYRTDLRGTAASAIYEWPITAKQLTDLSWLGIMQPHPGRVTLLIGLTRKGKPDMALVPRLVELVNTTADAAEREWAMRVLVKSPMRRDELARLAAPYAAKGERCAIEVLGECGAAAAKHRAVLLEILRKGKRYPGRAAAEAVLKSNTGAPELVDVLAEIVVREKHFHIHYDFKLAAARALARCGKPGVEKLKELTTDKFSKDVRRIATRGLGYQTGDHASGVARLIELANSDTTVATRAYEALVRLGPIAGPALARELKSGDRKRIIRAGRAFRDMGRAGEPWLEEIVAVWRQWAKGYGRAWGADNFPGGAVAAAGPKGAGKLVDLVAKGTDREANFAADALSRVDGTSLAPHVEALERHAKRLPAQYFLRQALARAYAETPDGRPKLLALMANPAGAVRREACRVRSVKKWRGDDVVAALVEAARRGTDRAFIDLAELGPAAKAALPALIEIARDKTRHTADYRAQALEPIARLGPGPEGIAVIRSVLQTGGTDEVNRAALATWKMDRRDAGKLADALRVAADREFRKEGQWSVVENIVVRALGKADPTSQASRRLYEKLIQDRRPPIARVGKAARGQATRLAEQTVASLSRELARRMRRLRGRLSDERIPRVLVELALKKDRRALPALRLAAAWSARAEERALARELLAAWPPR